VIEYLRVFCHAGFFRFSRRTVTLGICSVAHPQLDGGGWIMPCACQMTLVHRARPNVTPTANLTRMFHPETIARFLREDFAMKSAAPEQHQAPPITKAEKAAFVRQWAAFVWKLARKVARERPSCRGFTVDDLSQEGFIALLSAAERFDPNRQVAPGQRPVTFMTYARAHIYGLMRSAIDVNNGLIRYPSRWMNGGKGSRQDLPQVQQFELDRNGREIEA
jgi:Sigma-70 region 2